MTACWMHRPRHVRLYEKISNYEIRSIRRVLRVSFRNARVVSFFSGKPEAELWLLVASVRASSSIAGKRESDGVCAHTLARCVTPGLTAW